MMGRMWSLSRLKLPGTGSRSGPVQRVRRRCFFAGEVSSVASRVNVRARDDIEAGERKDAVRLGELPVVHVVPPERCELCAPCLGPGVPEVATDLPDE